MSVFEQEILDFQLTYLALSAGALILLMTAQTWTVRRALAPLLAIRVDLERLSSGAIQSLSENVPVEIKPLLRDRMAHQISAVHQRIERELKWARLSGTGTSGTHFQVMSDLQG